MKYLFLIIAIAYSIVHLFVGCSDNNQQETKKELVVSDKKDTTKEISRQYVDKNGLNLEYNSKGGYYVDYTYNIPLDSTICSASKSIKRVEADLSKSLFPSVIENPSSGIHFSIVINERLPFDSNLTGFFKLAGGDIINDDAKIYFYNDSTKLSFHFTYDEERIQDFSRKSDTYKDKELSDMYKELSDHYFAGKKLFHNNLEKIRISEEKSGTFFDIEFTPNTFVVFNEMKNQIKKVKYSESVEQLLYNQVCGIGSLDDF